MAAPTPDLQKMTKLVNRFRGISQYKSIVQSAMDNALDLLNVIVSPAGHLEKFRLPTVRTGPAQISLPVNGLQGIIDTLFFFSQGNGTRQLFANVGPGLGYFTDPETGANWPFTFVFEDPVTIGPRMRYVESNNLLFMVNGILCRKWTGGVLLRWGLPKPVSPPLLGVTVNVISAQRAGVNIDVFYSLIPPGPGGALFAGKGAQLGGLQVGDMVTLFGVDPALDGNLLVIVVGAANNETHLGSLAAGAIGPINTGQMIIYSAHLADTGTNNDFDIVGVERLNGVSRLHIANNFKIGAMGLPEVITVSLLPAPYDTFNGTWITQAITGGDAFGVQFNQLAPDVALAVPGAGTVKGGFTNKVSPRTWRFSWAITATGEEGPASDISVYVPNSQAGGLVNNIRAYLSIPAPPVGYGIDSFFLYASEDGGGTWVTSIGNNPSGDESWFIPNTAVPTFISVADDDTILDAAFSANFINFPPPQNMQFVQKWQGRVFGAGMPDAPQDIVYSGFDAIFRGRPETSFPPFNRIRLAIGAEKIKGFGVLNNGVVSWDDSDKMFMFSGTVQDVVTNQPVQIADQLEEEPWQTGLSSADSVQSTPKGIAWVGSDMGVKIWNGIFYGDIIGPRDLSSNIYPLMARITPAMRSLIQSAYFNWLERDWYVINVAIDGSLSPNRMIFFDMSEEGGQDNLGIWITNIEADSIAVKVTSDGTRKLVASIRGLVYELNISSTATSGIHTNPTATTGLLDAYWESGLWQDSPQMTKMYRFGRLTTDQSGFNLITTVFNDETVRLRDVNPWSKSLKMTPGGRFATNRRGRRQKFKIIFPTADVDASVLELYTTAIPLAEI